MRQAALLATIISCAASAAPIPLDMDDRGVVRIGDGELLANAVIAMHGRNWQRAGNESGIGNGVRSPDSVKGSIGLPANCKDALDFSVTREGASLTYEAAFTDRNDIYGCYVSFMLPSDRFAGRQAKRLLTIPSEHGDNFLFHGTVSQIRVAPEAPRGFVIRVNRPSKLLVQDNRGWGGSTVELRFNFRREEAGDTVPAGETVQRKFAFKLNGPMQVVLDESSATTETDKTDWVPFTLPWDDAPVDVSFLNHKPAGKFGFVTARDGKFVFAGTGEEARFWGTCFSAGANFPSHKQSEQIAGCLAKFGINMVRTHHADAPWAERHFFKKSADNTRDLDEENLDRFDHKNSQNSKELALSVVGRQRHGVHTGPQNHEQTKLGPSVRDEAVYSSVHEMRQRNTAGLRHRGQRARVDEHRRVVRIRKVSGRKAAPTECVHMQRGPAAGDSPPSVELAVSLEVGRSADDHAARDIDHDLASPTSGPYQGLRSAPSGYKQPTYGFELASKS